MEAPILFGLTTPTSTHSSMESHKNQWLFGGEAMWGFPNITSSGKGNLGQEYPQPIPLQEFLHFQQKISTQDFFNHLILMHHLNTSHNHIHMLFFVLSTITKSILWSLQPCDSQGINPEVKTVTLDRTHPPTPHRLGRTSLPSGKESNVPPSGTVQSPP